MCSNFFNNVAHSIALNLIREANLTLLSFQIQRRHYTNNEWKVASLFTQEDIEGSRVRYVHTEINDYNTDYFRLVLKKY